MAVLFGIPTHGEATPEELRRKLHYTDAGWLTHFALASGMREEWRVPGSPGSLTLFQEAGFYVVNDSITGGRVETQDLLRARREFTKFAERAAEQSGLLTLAG